MTFIMNCLSISAPSRRFILSGSRSSLVGALSEAITSISPSTTSPAPSISTSWQARCTAGMVPRGSRPFSKREDDSVRMPRAMAVLRMLVPLKLADSKTTVEVSPLISLLAPPITPARAMGFSASAITSIPPRSSWVFPSSVATSSPSPAVRTTMRPPLMQR